MKRILFVDDEPHILAGIENSLRKQRKHWEMVFVGSGHCALAELEKAPFDVVVSDMRMPIMDGAALLGEVKRLHPRTARLVLSGQADRAAIFRAIPVTQQFLSKPCDSEVLRSAIERVCALQTRIHDEAVRNLVGDVDQLPSLPDTYFELTRAMENPDIGVAQLGAIVEKDPALSAKVLQLANSAFFGAAKKTSSIRGAVTYLGVELLRMLALSAHVFALADSAPGRVSPLLAGLSEHSTAVALVVKRLLPEPKQAEQAVAAALVHDIGLLVLAGSAPDRAWQISKCTKAKGQPVHVIEQDLGGPTHAEIGAFLLGCWGLPFDLVETVAYHHLPSAASEYAATPLLTTLHVAEALVDGIQAGETDPTYGIDLAFADQVGLLSKLEGMRSIAEQELAEHAKGSGRR